MQQLRLRLDACNPQTNNNPAMVCESCLISIGRSARLCNYCLHFVCQQCAQNHDSHSSELPQLQSNAQWTHFSTEYQEFSKNQRASFQQLDSFVPSKLAFKALCQRCQSKIGSKICNGCSNKIYCLTCFNQLHSKEKFLSHQTSDLKRNEGKDTYESLYWIKRDQMLRITDKQKTQTHSYQLQTKLSDQIQQISGVIQKEKLQQINKNVVNLSLLKLSWEQTIQKMESTYDELFMSIKKELEEKIEELKLKILQIQLKIKSKKDHIAHQSEDYFEQINRTVVNYKNIEAILDNRKSSTDLYQIAQKKLSNLGKKCQGLHQKKQQILLENGNQLKISEQFYSEMSSLKQKISKIQFKKIVVKQEPKSIQILFSSPKAEKKLPLEFKSEKALNKSLNLATCKSQNKVNALKLSQNNSETNSKSRNNIKNQNKMLQSPILLKSYATTPSQQIFMTNRTLGFNSKSPNQPKKLGLEMKGFRSKGGLQKSARFSNKLPFFDSKSGVTKAIKNIQTTKKMISQLRTQMSEFSLNKLNIGQSECKTNTDKQNEQENEQYYQTISRISIDSLIADEEKEL